MNKIKFFIPGDLSYAASIWSSLLQQQGFAHKPEDDKGCERTIYLPANEKFPLAQELFTRDFGGQREETTLLCKRRAKGSQLQLVAEVLDEEVTQLLIEQARVISGRKLLPAFTRTYCSMRGWLDNVPAQATVEAISHAPAAMVGSYITLSAKGRPGTILPFLKSQLVRFVGTREIRWMDIEFEQAVRQLEPQFQWALTAKKK